MFRGSSSDRLEPRLIERNKMKKEKKYSKKKLKEMSKVLKPLEDILNEHYAKYIKPKHGDLLKKGTK